MNKKAIFAFALAMVTSLSIVTTATEKSMNATLAQIGNGVWYLYELNTVPTNHNENYNTTNVAGNGRYAGMYENWSPYTWSGGGYSLTGNGIDHVTETFPDGSYAKWVY